MLVIAWEDIFMILTSIYTTKYMQGVKNFEFKKGSRHDNIHQILDFLTQCMMISLIKALHHMASQLNIHSKFTIAN